MLLLLLFLWGCGRARTTDSAPEAALAVDPDHLDPPYRNEQLGAAFSPPLGWRPLEPDQRDRIAAVLTEVQEGQDGYSLELADLFLRAETMSFAALSRVSRGGEPVREPAAYIAAFAERVGAAEEDRLAARTDFTVNGVAITQFRHTQSERVTFTLVFASRSGELLQLNYSIPPQAYETEGPKLASSVGTIRHMEERP